MLNLQYIGDETFYEVEFHTINKNVVQIKGDMPVKNAGFYLTRIGEPEAFRGDYSAYITVFREIAGGVQFSNDESVYEEPVPRVLFYAGNGGTLEGEPVQEARNYEELVIPTPVASEQYEFVQWSPEIPASGAIGNNQVFVAVFAYIPTEEELKAILEQKKADRITESKVLLAAYLEDHPILSAAHGGKEGLYSVTSEKQSLMMSQYMTYQIEKTVNPDALLTWNETGKACEVWTEEEFLQLIMEIKEYVYPKVSYQQAVEEEIGDCMTEEELAAIVIDYSEV